MNGHELPKRPVTILDEALTRAILERRTGTPRFRLPLDAESAYNLLRSCYCAEVRYRHRIPDLTPGTLDRLWRLALFATQDSPKFGALLCGQVGNGKTTMLLAFRQAVAFMSDNGCFVNDEGRIEKRVLCIHNTKDIIQIARTDWPQYNTIRNTPLLAIDELGEEPREVRDYGNFLSPVTDLIEHRYNGQMFTLVTTNLAPNQIEDAYGARVADRFREMLTVVNFGGDKSFRR